MDKLSDVKVFLVARDKATNHLRIESRALKFDEVPDYIRKHVIPTADEYNWTFKEPLSREQCKEVLKELELNFDM